VLYLSALPRVVGRVIAVLVIGGESLACPRGGVRTVQRDLPLT
jgi:hypothetical protein